MSDAATPAVPLEPSGSPAEPDHTVSYPRFLARALWLATEGSPWFYAWMTLLTAVALVGFHAYGVQLRDGLAVTGMTDHVSWGLYIANFTFMVGLAAGGVMMVIPAYVYGDKDLHDISIVGELLAVAAIVMCLLFVVVDMGRPDRFWHLLPGIGRFNWPLSMLTWDVIVLNVYLLLNLHICGYLLYMRFLGREPERRWYLPFVMTSIVWAISIHTVTAFLYCGLGGRPFWNTALLAPRFLASAFVSGPVFLIVTLQLARRLSGLRVTDGALNVLLNIVRVTILINLLMLGSELFTEFYSGGSHTASATYLFFGLHGHSALVPWTWASLFLTVGAAILFLRPKLLTHTWQLNAACVMAFAGIWIEKGMGLIVPGFIPSTLHEVVEYVPTVAEWQISAGIWACGLGIFTVALKIALPIFNDGAAAAEAETEAAEAEAGTGADPGSESDQTRDDGTGAGLT